MDSILGCTINSFQNPVRLRMVWSGEIVVKEFRFMQTVPCISDKLDGIISMKIFDDLGRIEFPVERFSQTAEWVSQHQMVFCLGIAIGIVVQ